MNSSYRQSVWISERKMMILIWLVFGFSSSFAQQTQYPKLTKHQKDSLKKEIAVMLADDQKYRWMLRFGEMDEEKLSELRKMPDDKQVERIRAVTQNKAGMPKAQKDSLWVLQSNIDSANFIKLSALINTFGIDQCVEADGNITVFFLHFPEMMDNSLINLVKGQVKKGKISAEEFAMIYDRRQMAKKLPELYYVTPHYDSGTKKSALYVPINMDETNKAREEIGLKKYKQTE